MGGHLVNAALAVPKLDPLPRLVLVKMAATALDRDRPPVYRGGWDLLALSMGRDVYDDPAKRCVARCVATLVGRGLIVPDDWQNGHRRYLLLLGPYSTGSSTIVGTPQNGGPGPRRTTW